MIYASVFSLKLDCADGYLQILRQLMPNISHVIVFDSPVQTQLHTFLGDATR